MDVLVQNVSKPDGTASQKEAALEAIGYICSDIVNILILVHCLVFICNLLKWILKNLNKYFVTTRKDQQCWNVACMSK